jgi:chitodextrinase
MSTAAAAFPATDLVLGRYRPVRPLGSGGSGSVCATTCSCRSASPVSSAWRSHCSRPAAFSWSSRSRPICRDCVATTCAASPATSRHRPLALFAAAILGAGVTAAGAFGVAEAAAAHGDAVAPQSAQGPSAVQMLDRWPRWRASRRRGGWDTVQPTTPTQLEPTATTRTSVSLSWRASQDNRGVAGYGIYRDGARMLNVAGTSTTFSGLACGRSYTFGVDAFDAAGNRSPAATVTTSTSPCPDRLAPTVPGNLTLTSATSTALSLFWSTSLDDVGVRGYGVYLDGARVATADTTAHTLAGLTCGRTYALGVDAFDAAGNRSAVAGLTASTAPCAPPVTPPPPPSPPPAAPSSAPTSPPASVPIRGMVVNPIDPLQLSALEFGERSHWLQPWRAYLDTWPSARLHDGIGMVAHTASASEIGTYAALMGRAGVRHARLEFNWGGMSYADETQPVDATLWRTQLRTLKANGIRPLILLNWHHGRPCPARVFSAQVIGSAGSRTVTFRPPVGEPVVLGHTGISEGDTPHGSVGAYYLIESYNAASGQATLSQPLRRSYNGQTEAMTLKYRPFDLPGTAGFEQTMAGLLRYVDAIVAFASSEVGANGFDLEFYNEMTFGYAFWSIAHYRGGDEDWYWNQGREAFRRFVAHVRSRYGSSIGLTDGLASQLPWTGGGSGPASEPAGTTAMSKHYYAGVGTSPTSGGGENVDAFGNPTTFQPVYSFAFPEYWLTAIQTETLIRDISPTLETIGGETHGRPTGLAVWETEFNQETTDWNVKTKTALRSVVSHIHKGVERVYFHAAKESPNFVMVDPAQPDGGPVLRSLRRLLDAVPNSTASGRPLGLASISDTHDHAQFQGDGTQRHPPLYDRELVGFHPFQTGAAAWAIPVYVQTRDALAAYTPREFTLEITGLAGQRASASLYDPLSDANVPLSVVSRGADRIVVSLPLGDYPRVLTLREGS